MDLSKKIQFSINHIMEPIPAKKIIVEQVGDYPWQPRIHLPDGTIKKLCYNVDFHFPAWAMRFHLDGGYTLTIREDTTQVAIHIVDDRIVRVSDLYTGEDVFRFTISDDHPFILFFNIVKEFVPDPA